MSALDDEVTVWRLAILTDDLGRDEHAALRRVGERLEKLWNRQTRMNIERRLAKHGMVDLFGEWGQARAAKHQEWWVRKVGEFEELVVRNRVPGQPDVVFDRRREQV